jgi:catechol 2,3-dioxygenase-like lactoylglutathione lyase family enzyme
VIISAAHPGITVKDVEGSLRFYGDILGLEDNKGARAIYFVGPDNVPPELFQKPPVSAPLISQWR